MKTKFLVFTLLAFALILSACGPTAVSEPVNLPVATAAPMEPTIFMCWEDGKVVVDVQTLNGATLEIVDQQKKWVWEGSDENGSLVKTKELNCMQDGLSYSRVKEPDQFLNPSVFTCVHAGKEIFSILTIDGAIMKDVDAGEYFTNAWTWYDSDGPHYITEDGADGAIWGDDLFCTDEPIK